MMARSRSAVLGVLIVFGTAVGNIGCRGAAAVFLDLPEESEQTVPANPRSSARALQASAMMSVPQDTARPFIEAVAHDSAVALLPKDAVGNIDWVAALEDGIIDPQRNRPGGIPRRDMSGFGFDFLIKGPNPMFDAAFPHSTHVEWLACESCHPTVFPYRGAEITMAAINQGEYCGACHGKVAFPVETGCMRCHPSLNMPPSGKAADGLGELVFQRPSDSTAQGSFGTSQFPPARFSHTVHQMRFRCMACHPDPFKAQAGANEITMDDVSSRRACGVCHDGGVAFSGLQGCSRCHVATSASGDSEP
jgi:c(7)-type cytochrome triheme protein